jgi:hypothetical protein
LMRVFAIISLAAMTLWWLLRRQPGAVAARWPLS